jgi:hypothetical protein
VPIPWVPAAVSPSTTELSEVQTVPDSSTSVVVTRRPDPRCSTLDGRAAVEAHTSGWDGGVNRIVTEPSKERFTRSKSAYKPR